MSFILDALRKSEIERQQEAAPRVMHLPLAVPGPTLPAWALAVMAVLAACVLVLAGAWWQGTRAPSAAATDSTPQPIESAPVAAATHSTPQPTESAPSGSAAATRTVPAPAGVERPDLEPAADAPADLATAARGPSDARAGSGEADKAVAPTSPSRAPSEPSRAASNLPTRAQLLAEGVAIPPLRIDLHSFGESPAQRFLFINGTRYAEGERLEQGPRLVAITRNGAVMSYEGREFRLSPD